MPILHDSSEIETCEPRQHNRYGNNYTSGDLDLRFRVTKQIHTGNFVNLKLVLA